MRNNATLDALFSNVRADVLSATLLQPEHWWFLTELAVHLRVTPSSLKRELESLALAGDNYRPMQSALTKWLLKPQQLVQRRPNLTWRPRAEFRYGVIVKVADKASYF